MFTLAEAGFQDGLHIFKVELDDYRAEGPVWRQLAVPARCSLDERRESGQGRRPKLIGSAGRAPKQYPDWE